MSQKGVPQIPNYLNFIIGGSAGMAATCVVQPLDLVKNRMQLSGMHGKTKDYKNSFHLIINILRNEGFSKLYTGLSAGLLRQATYTTTRLGVFSWLSENNKGVAGTPLNFLLKLVNGITAGAAGGFVGTPAEVALVRMTADGRLPVSERRNYKNVFDALIRMKREEGLLSLWRGAVPTMGRAMVVNAAQLSSYSQVKEYLLNTGHFEDNVICQFVSSMISGVVTTTTSMPVDIAKTRIQNMKTICGKPEYKGAIDVLIKVIRNEGFFALWKGFTPYYARLGPHTVLTFVFMEQMKAFYFSQKRTTQEINETTKGDILLHSENGNKPKRFH